MDPDDMPDDALQVARDCQGWQDRLKNLVVDVTSTFKVGGYPTNYEMQATGG